MTTLDLKPHLTTLEFSPWPQPDPILQVRTGKQQQKALGPNTSAIFKQPQKHRIYISPSGLTGDEHAYPAHRESHRAVHQYSSQNYKLWQKEKPDLAHLFQNGGFGENLVATKLTEENVCIGDIWCIGNEQDEGSCLLEVSEPRNPCYKLNIRFQWTRALPRISKTGRVGWNFRVLRPGYVETGSILTLVKRPNPYWSVANIVRVLHGRSVEPHLYEECLELEALSPYFHDLAEKRLANATRLYKLVEARYVTPRVRQLTFQGGKVTKKEFAPYAYAQIQFGPNKNLSRCYSIVDGNLERFTLGVSLDEASRGGSEYLHKSIQVGDEISMAPGSDPTTAEHEEKCGLDKGIQNRVVIIGGIGVTAFLPAIRGWEEQGIPYEIHYAIRSTEEAAYQDLLPKEKTTYYAKSQGKRLNIDEVVPKGKADGRFHTRIFCCGPSKMMDACRERTEELGYPEHLVHFESFGNAVGAGEPMGDPFEVEVHDPESNRTMTLDVPADKTLLRVLNDAGFDVMSSCQSGGCGICKVALCEGEVEYHSSVNVSERGQMMQTCVDRAKGARIAIEVD